MGKPNSYTAYIFTIIGTLIPTCYIWLLPFFASIGYAEETCDNGTLTISCYISSPQATGGMAGMFYFPII